jgi:hypothetical protein
VVELDVRELRGDLVGDLSPEPRRGEDVGLVDAGDAAASRPRQLEGEAHDPGDLGLRIRERIAR